MIKYALPYLSYLIMAALLLGAIYWPPKGRHER